MTALNRAAYLTPTASGPALGYFDGTTATTIATDSAHCCSGFTIDSLNSAESFAPMVNDNGWVVFEGLVTKDGNPGGYGSQLAIMAWNAASPTVQLVASLGDALSFQSGDPNFATNTIGGIDTILDNNKGFDADVLKDGLSDDNHLAFSANLITNPSRGPDEDPTFKDVVLVTQLSAVPEPTALMLLPMVGLMLLRRSRRG